MSGVDAAATRLAMNAVRGIPRDRDGPVFREPWQAQAFAMVLAGHDMTLVAAHGVTMTIVCEGDDAETAVAALAELVDAGFGEGVDP